jgi:hypothetical protein
MTTANESPTCAAVIALAVQVMEASASSIAEINRNASAEQLERNSVSLSDVACVIDVQMVPAVVSG